jgi:DNA-binding Lrp family transcriptional regulator
MWQKIKNIQIPGPIAAVSLTAMILGTTTVLFTVLPVRPPSVNTSEESISGKNESLELLILVGDEELHLKVTGNNTTEVVQSLKRILQRMDGTILLEKS